MRILDAIAGTRSKWEYKCIKCGLVQPFASKQKYTGKDGICKNKNGCTGHLKAFKRG